MGERERVREKVWKELSWKFEVDGFSHRKCTLAQEPNKSSVEVSYFVQDVPSATFEREKKGT